MATEWAVGNLVALKTELGQEITGSVFAYDSSAQVLVVKQKGSHNGVSNLAILNTAMDIQTLQNNKPEVPVDLELPVVDMARCRAREEKALRLAEQEAGRVGVGVSKEAQAIFEALSKTLPCRWFKKTIIVLDEVQVPEPYTVESCAPSDVRLNPKTLDRVKLIVRDARARLGLPDT